MTNVCWHDPAIGTKRAYRHSATMSALEAKPDDICSLRAFPVLTHFGPQGAPCKLRFRCSQASFIRAPDPWASVDGAMTRRAAPAAMWDVFLRNRSA